ncbi:MAG: FAD-dependent tricarballylate dehydrogenase TcuA [Microcella sp.]
MIKQYDVIVVGGGNAGFCAALSARENGSSVLLVEKGEEHESGGNSFYTAAAFRVVHDGGDALGSYFDAETQARLPETELAPYTEGEFLDDLERVTEGRGDRTMAQVLAKGSREVVPWLASHGFVWRLMYERQAYFSEGKQVFFGGLAVSPVGGGKGLISAHEEAAANAGVHVRYGAEVTELLTEGEAVEGVRVAIAGGGEEEFHAKSVVLAAGGFEANPRMREKHLGTGWDQAYVRGTPLNTGDVLELALRHGASRHGDWSTCHSTAWDVAAPAAGGDRLLTNQYTRQSYPIGVVVNVMGMRFLDEGADFRNYTYAKYGAQILAQPEGRAFQLYDSKTRSLLRREEYESAGVTEFVADSLHELAQAAGIDPGGLERTVHDFNASIEQKPFDPAIKDGRAAHTEPPKSNWALELDSPPFYAYPVTCGITFTFGGLKVDESARVLSADGLPMGGLFAAGEIVGGLFSINYPGGSGLTAGTVYGRLAGREAAQYARAVAVAS